MEVLGEHLTAVTKSMGSRQARKGWWGRGGRGHVTSIGRLSDPSAPKTRLRRSSDRAPSITWQHIMGKRYLQHRQVDPKLPCVQSDLIWSAKCSRSRRIRLEKKDPVESPEKDLNLLNEDGESTAQITSMSRIQFGLQTWSAYSKLYTSWTVTSEQKYIEAAVSKWAINSVKIKTVNMWFSDENKFNSFWFLKIYWNQIDRLLWFYFYTPNI